MHPWDAMPPILAPSSIESTRTHLRAAADAAASWLLPKSSAETVAVAFVSFRASVPELERAAPGAAVDSMPSSACEADVEAAAAADRAGVTPSTAFNDGAKAAATTTAGRANVRITRSTRLLARSPILCFSTCSSLLVSRDVDSTAQWACSPCGTAHSRSARSVPPSPSLATSALSTTWCVRATTLVDIALPKSWRSAAAASGAISSATTAAADWDGSRAAALGTREGAARGVAAGWDAAAVAVGGVATISSTCGLAIPHTRWKSPMCCVPMDPLHVPQMRRRLATVVAPPMLMLVTCPQTNSACVMGVVWQHAHLALPMSRPTCVYQTCVLTALGVVGRDSAPAASPAGVSRFCNEGVAVGNCVYQSLMLHNMTVVDLLVWRYTSW